MGGTKGEGGMDIEERDKEEAKEERREERRKVSLDEGGGLRRSDSSILPTTITNNLPFVASLLNASRSSQALKASPSARALPASLATLATGILILALLGVAASRFKRGR